MAYLFVLNGRERYRVFQLTRDSHEIGQRPDAHLVVRDPWISWDHARIVREGAGWAIEDLGSTNGTYVDCIRVERRALFEDDVLFLGRTHLLFVASNRLPSAPPLRSPPSRSSPGERSFEATTRLVRQASDINVEPLVDEDLATMPVEPIPGEWSEAMDPENLPALTYAVEPARPQAKEPMLVGSPLDHAGPIDALDAIDDEVIDVEGEGSDDGPEVGEDGVAYDMTPPPPPLVPQSRGKVRSASGVEIDVGDLLDSGGRVLPEPPPPDDTDVGGNTPISSFAGAAPIFRPLDASLDPIEARDAEIERLRIALQARDAEVRRLRDEVRRLKEQYLDL